MIERIAVVQWVPEEGLAQAICNELAGLGREPIPFLFDESIPDRVDMVLTFAPYGKLLPIARQMEQFNSQKRPIFLHWHTQNLPDPSIPWIFTKQVARFRSWLDRLDTSSRSVSLFIANLKPLQWLSQRMHRFRYVGDHYYAFSQGWLDVLIQSSKIYTQYDHAHGIPSIYVPWGTSRDWYADLHLDRNIDVLWFGKRRTRRRSQLLDIIRRELQVQGINMYVVDGEERPFIYDDERTKILNRTKIVLGLGIYPYDNVSSYRFQMVAGNRCLLISEPELDHHPFIPGKHFIEATADKIVDRVLYFLAHEEERSQITKDAYCLVTEKLTMANSLRNILNIAENAALQMTPSAKSFSTHL